MMNEKTNARKKYLIAIILLIVGLIGITGAIIGIYAASNQGLGGRFQISYKLNDDIAVEVSAKYEPEQSNEVNLGTVRFDVYSTENEAVLGSKDVIWLAPSESILFTYTFNNLSKTQKALITPTWTNFTTNTANMTVWCVTPTTETYITSAADMSKLVTELPADEELTITFLFSVENGSANAFVSSSENGGLTFDLSYMQ